MNIRLEYPGALFLLILHAILCRVKREYGPVGRFQVGVPTYLGLATVASVLFPSPICRNWKHRQGLCLCKRFGLPLCASAFVMPHVSVMRVDEVGHVAKLARSNLLSQKEAIETPFF
jgi:hypothetical protein